MTSVSRSLDAPPVGRYRIEPAGSEIAFSAKHLFGLATVRGRLTVLSGELVVTDDVASSQAAVTASAASFDSGDARRDRAITAARFLDVQRHPALHFASTQVTRADSQWVVAGLLTAHGVQAPLRLTVGDLAVDGTGLTVRATGRVDRYEHAITAARGMAGRYVDVRITARAVAQTPPD